MARLNTYTTDTDVAGNDKVLGTDIGGATKNYTLDSIAEYFTKHNVVNVAGQLSFLFDEIAADRGNGKFFINNGTSGTGTSVSAITSFTISEKQFIGNDLSVMLNKIVDNKFLFTENRDQNIKGVFTTQSVSDNADADFLDVTVSVEDATGSITQDTIYSFSIFEQEGDKSFVFTQGVPAVTWSITHNLGKKPSVTVVDSADQTVVGDVTYTNNNSLTITFSAGFSGKAYLN